MGRSGSIAAGLAVLLTLTVVPAAAQDDTAESIGERADSGARIVAVDERTPRERDLTIESPAVGTVQVRLLVPAGYAEQAGVRHPTLLLLHGGGGQFDDWTQETSVEAITAADDLLVAMPDAASSNLGTWLPEGGPDGLGGPPNWEAFHIVELPQLLERNFRASGARAIAGLSLGGWGAVMAAAQHPEQFEAVASFSGAVDLSASAAESPRAQAVIAAAEQVAEGAGWGESNPINLVEGLEGLDVYVSYGNGQPGDLDDADREADPLEAWIGKGNDNFVAAMEDAGIAATINAYGEGTHSWPYWERELEASLPMLLEALAEE